MGWSGERASGLSLICARLTGMRKVWRDGDGRAALFRKAATGRDDQHALQHGAMDDCMTNILGDAVVR